MFRTIAQLPRRTCTSCGATIVWVHTQAGKRMPLNADPDPNGIVTQVDTGNDDDVALIVRVTPKASRFEEEPTLPRYTSHFATCPNGKAHRRR